MKKFISFVMAFSLMFMLFDLPADVFAEDIPTSGSCGDNVTWALDEHGTLTISGSGAMKDYNENYFSPDYFTNTPFYPIKDRVFEIVIEEGVTTIGAYAFNNCGSLKRVIIPESVTSIGNSAFWSGNNLTNIIIPGSVKKIEGHAFSNCSSLSSVTLSEGELLQIGDYAFFGCNSLSSISIPNSVAFLGEFAFSNCGSLSSVTLSDKLTKIAHGAFYKCDLTSVEIPASVTSIELSAFAHNKNLSSVTIPSNVTILNGSEHGGAFDECTSLESVTFEGTTTIPTLQENVFRNCEFITDNDETTGITLPSCKYLSDYLGASGWDIYKDHILNKHNITEEAAKDANCTDDGKTHHWKCTVCGSVFSDSTGDTAITEADVTIPATGHQWDNGTIITQPTETAEGVKKYTCTVCQATKNETIPMLGHTHAPDSAWDSDTVGHWHNCPGCTEKVDYSEHTENGGVETIAPTETTEGEMTYRCTVCGAVTRTETIPATGTVPVPTPTPPSPPVTYPAPIAPTVSPAAPADNNEPFIVDNRGIEGWEAISEDINITADGGIVDIDMNGTNILPQDIINDIAGRDIDLVLEMSGGITWTINGMSVIDAQRTNMKVYIDRGRIPNAVLDTVSEDAYVKELTLKHTGEFGFTPVLTLKMPDNYEEKYANLFYYNPKSGEMEFVNFGVIRDGAVKLAFSHASEYAVVVSDVPMGGESVSVAAGADSIGGFVGTFAAEEVPKYGIIFIAVILAAVLALRKCGQK